MRQIHIIASIECVIYLFSYFDLKIKHRREIKVITQILTSAQSTQKFLCKNISQGKI